MDGSVCCGSAARFIRIFAVTNILLGIAAWFILEDDEHSAQDVVKKVAMAEVKTVLKMPAVWLISLVVMAAYSAYWGTFYFTPYATDALGLSVVIGGAIGVGKGWLKPLAAIGAGFLADKIGVATSVFGCFLILIFGFTLQKRITEIDGFPEISYTLFILPGLIMMNTLTNASSNSSSSMLQMKLLQQLPDILCAPLSSFEISMAYIIGGAVRGFVNGVLVLLLGVFLVGMPVVSPVKALVFLFIVSWAFSSMGLFLGQMADSWDKLATMQNFFLTPLSFLGGIFYSVQMLPNWAQTLSFLNPIYYMINGIRYTVLGVSDSPPEISFIMALIMTILFTCAAVLLMKSGKKIKS